MRCGRSCRALARRLLPVFVRGVGGGISFCASDGVLFPHGESTPPEAEHDDLFAYPRQNAEILP